MDVNLIIICLICFSSRSRGVNFQVQGSCATQVLYPDLDRRVSDRFWPGPSHQLTSVAKH